MEEEGVFRPSLLREEEGFVVVQGSDRRSLEAESVKQTGQNARWRRTTAAAHQLEASKQRRRTKLFLRREAFFFVVVVVVFSWRT